MSDGWKDEIFRNWIECQREIDARMNALEQKVDATTDRIIFVLACEMKMQTIRQDLAVVHHRLSQLASEESDVHIKCLCALREGLDAPQLAWVHSYHLGGLLDCLRKISRLVREEMLHSQEISKWAMQHANDELAEFWKRAEEEEKRRGDI